MGTTYRPPGDDTAYDAAAAADAARLGYGTDTTGTTHRPDAGTTARPS